VWESVPFPAVTMMSAAESVSENCTVEWLEWHRSSGYEPSQPSATAP
jgi:hypothetical protein